jgi:hypothetical protein
LTTTIKSSLPAFFGELEKIGQAPGSLAHRAQLGAPGAWGSLGSSGGASSGGASSGGVSPPTGPGSSGGAGASMPKPPTAGEMGGGMSAADLGLSGSNPPPIQAPTQPQQPMSATGTPPPGAPATAPGSLASPQRKKGFGTGTLSSAESAEVAPPSASEFGG